MNVLVTGAAGFIGMHVSERLLDRGDQVVGLDNLNGYYDPQLKISRLARLTAKPGFSFYELDISERTKVEDLFLNHKFDRVIHLAAQAGVRYSIVNPHSYITSNIQGFLNILEGCRRQQAQHLVYASSSSVYGGNGRMPFSERHAVDHPVSLYAATKKSNELMAHTYSHLFGLRTTGLRFFTVYGPWGRPDMALFLFTKAILEGQPIDVYNNGRMMRDFTYIDDVAEAVVRVLDRPATPDPAYDPVTADPSRSNAPFRLLNVGNHSPTPLMDFIAAIEQAVGRQAIKNFMPLQDGDLTATYADVDELVAWTAYRPTTPVTEGVGRFVTWYRDYFRV